MIESAGIAGGINRGGTQKPEGPILRVKKPSDLKRCMILLVLLNHDKAVKFDPETLRRQYDGSIETVLGSCRA
jgi:hypothetical protein